ncbi:MAG TPA: ABC transporter substrate-binding protein [Solirubrobacteraceae bacterium]|nr:ABC transporter substrate-binding protein [Solirubrobacteraceae bacterium]
MLAVIGALVLAGCGGSSSSSQSSNRAATTATNASSSPSSPGGTVQMLMGTAPQSLDPGLDYTSEGGEINWLVYTGLTTYTHANGNAGSRLIPGLATALPVISDGGKTYTVTLRQGLVFSNGAPVLASDFTYTVERALKIPWPGSGAFIARTIVGALAYANGKAKTVSGITTDNATGRIVIRLTAAYGPFDNVLAFPALGIIPAGTPMKPEPTKPPPGVGPYEVTDIVPNQSFSVVRNPHWASMRISGIPAGHVNVDVRISPNLDANALSVLDNSADVFDWSDTVPGYLVPQIRARAADRFRMVDLGGATYFIFMNTAEKPFSSQLAREAVVTGLNQDAMARIGDGTLQPACFLLPPDVPGHPSAPCPYGTPGTGNLAKAKALVAKSGMAGQPITVWSESTNPFQQWMVYYTQFLDSIGFRATLKAVANAVYWTNIAAEKTLHPQTGFGAWLEDFANPIDFYAVLLDGNSITPTGNENNDEVNDPHINAEINKLAATPTTELGAVAGQWQTLDEYVAKKAYLAVFGYVSYPEFASDRIDYNAVIFEPLYGWDLSSLQLK